MSGDFYLFASEGYYPSGGFGDYQGRYPDMETLKQHLKQYQHVATTLRAREDWGGPSPWGWAQAIRFTEDGEPVEVAYWDCEAGWMDGPPPWRQDHQEWRERQFRESVAKLAAEQMEPVK